VSSARASDHWVFRRLRVRSRVEYGAAEVATRGRRRARERRHSSTVPFSLFQTSPKIQTGVLRTLNTKVIEQVTLFNNAKGSIGFYSLVWAGTSVQNSQKLGACEQWFSALICIFHKFALQTSNATQQRSGVPWNSSHFSHWAVLKCLAKFWRMCQSSRLAQGGQRGH
jgi:hypothetical protein